MCYCFFMSNILKFLINTQDELITHSKPESISVSVHYGGERSNDPEVIAEPDVVLTTYGVLTAAYKSVICSDSYISVYFVDPYQDL